MAFSDIKKSRKAKIIAAAVAAIAAFAAITLLAASCSRDNTAGAIGADRAIARAIEGMEDGVEETHGGEASFEDASASTIDEEGTRDDVDKASASETSQAAEPAESGNHEGERPAKNKGNAAYGTPER